MTSMYHTLTVTRIHEEIPDVKTFYFEGEEAQAIPYKAGQYLTLVAVESGTEIRRSYSITSTPALHEPLAVGVKRIENGYFSRKLIDNTKVGDQFVTIGAGGFFTLPDDMHTVRQLFFFAAGSGITPIFSLIKTVLVAHAHASVVLIYSNHSQESTIFYHELLQLQNRYKDRFHIEFLFSNSANLLKAHLHTNLLIAYLEQYAIVELNKLLYYICGPLNYMRLCTYTLQQLGVSSKHIKKESFNADRAVAKAAPPDKNEHNVLLHYKGTTYTLKVQYPSTILQAAKDHHIYLPFSCEVGRCGNCAAKCIRGKVWHSNNEVLTERELEDGLVLTCVGYPVGGDAEIIIS